MKPNCYTIITYANRPNYAIASTQHLGETEIVTIESREFSRGERKGVDNSAYRPATDWAKKQCGHRRSLPD